MNPEGRLVKGLVLVKHPLLINETLQSLFLEETSSPLSFFQMLHLVAFFVASTNDGNATDQRLRDIGFKWRWRESNPRPPVPWQAFSERSQPSVVESESRLATISLPIFTEVSLESGKAQLQGKSYLMTSRFRPAGLRPDERRCSRQRG